MDKARVLWAFAVLLLSLMQAAGAAPAAGLPGFEPSGWHKEQMRHQRTAEGIRYITLIPDGFRQDRATLHVVYATPNGNTVEQTLGRSLVPGLDWHFDIQHVAAQVRAVQAADPARNYVLTVAEADGLSWPSWRSKTAAANKLIASFVNQIRSSVDGSETKVCVVGHSGGGSFVLGFLEDGPLPEWVEKIVFLDANYSFAVEKGHGQALSTWLEGDRARRLVVFAYDDRDVTLGGKKIVSSTGGTYRATERMAGYFEKTRGLLKNGRSGSFVTRSWEGGRALFCIHPNPDLKILHTAMIGEMNALMFSLGWGTKLEPRMRLGEPRAYTRFVQPPDLPEDASIPERPSSAGGASAIVRAVAKLGREDREARLLAELLYGNIPRHSRAFTPVTTSAVCSDGQKHSIRLQVLSDYLMIGSDSDSMRVCVNPYSAQAAADALGCLLPTPAIVDAVWRQSEVKVAPLPLTSERESPQTFLKHSRMIDAQLAGSRAGALSAGMKKDIVISKLLQERADRVAIYGWHKLDGSAIQPLTTVHVDWYVDYSHGIRLVKRLCEVDGQKTDLELVLKDPVLSQLVSGEGPIKAPRYLKSGVSAGR